MSERKHKSGKNGKGLETLCDAVDVGGGLSNYIFVHNKSESMFLTI